MFKIYSIGNKIIKQKKKKKPKFEINLIKIRVIEC